MPFMIVPTCGILKKETDGLPSLRQQIRSINVLTVASKQEEAFSQYPNQQETPDALDPQSPSFVHNTEKLQELHLSREHYWPSLQTSRCCRRASASLPCTPPLVSPRAKHLGNGTITGDPVFQTNQFRVRIASSKRKWPSTYPTTVAVLLTQFQVCEEELPRHSCGGAFATLDEAGHATTVTCFHLLQKAMSTLMSCARLARTTSIGVSRESTSIQALPT